MDPFASHKSGWSDGYGVGLVSTPSTGKHYVVVYRIGHGDHAKKLDQLGPFDHKPTFSEALSLMGLYFASKEN